MSVASRLTCCERVNWLFKIICCTLVSFYSVKVNSWCFCACVTWQNLIATIASSDFIIIVIWATHGQLVGADVRQRCLTNGVFLFLTYCLTNNNILLYPFHIIRHPRVCLSEILLTSTFMDLFV